MRRIHDVSVPIVSGGVVYPGNPPIAIEPQTSIAKGASSNVSKISFGSHTATHVDAPRHFFDGGAPVDELPLDVLIGPALLIRMPDDVMAITAEHLRAANLGDHTRVLFSTRNSSFIRGPEFVPDFTYVAPDAAEFLVEAGVRLVGVDYLSVEQFRSAHHRTHRRLLQAGVVIVEGLDLSAPAPGRYELICLPLLMKGLDGAPCRAVLIEDDSLSRG
jgi:arylformamidase